MSQKMMSRERERERGHESNDRSGGVRLESSLSRPRCSIAVRSSRDIKNTLVMILELPSSPMLARSACCGERAIVSGSRQAINKSILTAAGNSCSK